MSTGTRARHRKTRTTSGSICVRRHPGKDLPLTPPAPGEAGMPGTGVADPPAPDPGWPDTSPDVTWRLAAAWFAVYLGIVLVLTAFAVSVLLRLWIHEGVTSPLP